MLTHGLADSLPQSSGTVEVAGEIAKEAKRSTRKIVFIRSVDVEAIFVFLLEVCVVYCLCALNWTYGLSQVI